MDDIEMNAKVAEDRAMNNLEDIVMDDGECNPLSGFGYKRMGTQVEQVDTIQKNLRWYLVTNLRQILAQAYAEIGVVQTVCNVPVDDGLHGGITFRSKIMGEDELTELSDCFEGVDLAIASEAAKWNRLFGGAGVIVMTEQDPETPLDLESITDADKVEFRAADVWELNPTPKGGTSLEMADYNNEYFYYYGQRIHRSRVLLLKGLEAPSYIKPRLRGFGLSVVEILVRSVNQYLKSTDLAFEVLDEFKVDFYKLSKLNQSLLRGEDEHIRKRLDLANMSKSFRQGVALDAEDDWDHKQLSFTGLAEIMQQIRMQVASDMRMPLTKIFGQSASGFNSGEDDIEVYNTMVEGQVRTKLKPVLLEMAKIRCKEMFGLVPEDLSIEFKPLRRLGATDEQAVKTSKSNAIFAAFAAGLISADEAREALNKAEVFDVTLTGSAPLAVPVPSEGSEPGNPPGGKPPASAPTKPKAPATLVANKRDFKSWSRMARIDRVLANSAQFDKAEYMADGGDAWVNPARRQFFENPKDVDVTLWNKARAASIAAVGEVRWQFVLWFYKKNGGKFQSW